MGNWLVEASAKVSMATGMFLVAVLAIFITVYVILRALKISTFGLYEVTLLLLVAFVLSGAAYTEKRESHMVLEIVSSRFSPKVQELLKCIGLVLGMFFSTLFMWRLIVFTVGLYVKGTFYLGPVQLLYWPAYAVMCVVFMCFCIVLLAHLIQSIRLNIENFRKPPS